MMAGQNFESVAGACADPDVVGYVVQVVPHGGIWITIDPATVDELPAGVRQVGRHREERSTKKIPAGEDCKTRRKDNGDGTISSSPDYATNMRVSLRTGTASQAVGSSYRSKRLSCMTTGDRATVQAQTFARQD